MGGLLLGPLVAPELIPADVPPVPEDDADDPPVVTLNGEANDARILSRRRIVTGWTTIVCH